MGILSRWNVLIGLGVVGAGTLAGLDNFTDVLEDGYSTIGGEDPLLTNPKHEDTDNTAFLTDGTPTNSSSPSSGTRQGRKDRRLVRNLIPVQ